MRYLIPVILTISFLFPIPNALAEESKKPTFEEAHKDKGYIILSYDKSLIVNEDWSYTETLHARKKVVKDTARNLGELPIYYSKNRQEVIDIEAFTITPDGRKHRPSKMQDLPLYSETPQYSDSMVKVITFPEVNVGSVIDYKYTIKTKRSLIKDAFWDVFGFPDNTPIEECRFTYTFPEKLNIAYKEYNLSRKPAIDKKNSKVTYTFKVKDFYVEDPAEMFSPPPSDKTVKNIFTFSSIGKWSDISVWYYNLINKNLKITPEIKKAAIKAAAGKTTLEDKTRAVLEYIQDNFRYVSLSFGDNALEPHATDQVFANKFGDCKDLSLLCMAMLKVLGIESNIALFRQEFEATDPQYDLPHPTVFNHVLLFVKDPEGAGFFVDPLLNGYDIGEYPLSYQAAYTFLITKDGGEFKRFKIFDEKSYAGKSTLEISIEPDGTALFEQNAVMNIHLSIAMRMDMKTFNEAQKAELIERLCEQVVSGGELIDFKIEGLEERYGNIKVYSKYKQPKKFQVIDNMILVNIESDKRDVAFTKKTRENPIFWPYNKMIERTTTYTRPEGFEISHLPKELDLDIGFYKLKREFREEGDKLKATYRLVYTRMELPVEGYLKVKDFFDKLPEHTRQTIIFKKT